MIGAGCMIGTSLDGLDVALVDFSGDAPRLLEGSDHELVAADAARLRALAAGEPAASAAFAGLGVALALDHERAVRAACAASAVEVDFVCAHGVTISHVPRGEHPHSWQLLDAAGLAARLGCPVVADLRSADVAMGGEGAPLAPIVDARLRRSDAEDRVILNLGGIANLTLLSADAARAPIAGDVGPANLPLDALVRAAGRGAFDADGRLAAAGTVHASLLETLRAGAWMQRPLPRSFGREEFGDPFVAEVVAAAPDASLEDRLATLVELEAIALSQLLAAHAVRWRAREDRPAAVYLTGGGRRNRALVAAFERHMPRLRFAPIEELGESGDHKEAFDFAVLGHMRLNRERASNAAATGARADCVLGALHDPTGRWG